MVKIIIEDICLSNIIKGHVLLLENINVHSLSWNPQYIKKQNVRLLENFIDKFKLIINYNMNYPIRSQSQRIFIIDFALTTASFRPFTLSKIPKKYLSVSDHEFILL